MELIELLPPEMNAKLRGKRVDKEKLEAMCRKALESAVISYIADGSGGTNDGFLKTAIMAIQMVWNEKEEWKAKCERLESPSFASGVRDILLDYIPSDGGLSEAVEKIKALIAGENPDVLRV